MVREVFNHRISPIRCQLLKSQIDGQVLTIQRLALFVGNSQLISAIMLSERTFRLMDKSGLDSSLKRRLMSRIIIGPASLSETFWAAICFAGSSR